MKTLAVLILVSSMSYASPVTFFFRAPGNGDIPLYTIDFSQFVLRDGNSGYHYYGTSTLKHIWGDRATYTHNCVIDLSAFVTCGYAEPRDAGTFAERLNAYPLYEQDRTAPIDDMSVRFAGMFHALYPQAIISTTYQPGPVSDINSDGSIDAADAGILFGEWTADAAPLPEPSTLTLAMCLLGPTMPARSKVTRH